MKKDKTPKIDPEIKTPQDLISRLTDYLSMLISLCLIDLETLETVSLEDLEDLTDWTDPETGDPGVLTVETAKTLTYGQTLYHLIYVNSDQTPQRFRVNGRPQVWKTRPDQVRVPVKRGIYEYAQIWHDDLDQFSLSESFASLDHGRESESERLTRSLWSRVSGLQSFCIHIGDQIGDFESDSGHSYIRPERLTEDLRSSLETLSRVSRSLSLFLRRIISDLETGDPETLEILRSSHVYLSDLYNDPEIWSETGDNLRELTPDLVSGLFQTWRLFDNMTIKGKERRPSKSEDLIGLIRMIEDKKIKSLETRDPKSEDPDRV